MKNDLKGTKGVILQDGWSTQQNDPLISHCLNTGFSSHCIASENPGTEKATAEYCAQLIEKTILDVELEYDCKIIGLITDNCSTMTATQKLIRERRPDLEAYGCNSHLFNLLGKHFTPEDLQNKVNIVQTYMRNHHFTCAGMKKNKTARPILPGSTRWNSQIDSFINYCESHPKYLEIVRQIPNPTDQAGKRKLQDVLAVLNDATIYDELQATIKILSPICTALDKTQGEKANIADAASAWVDCISMLPEDIVESYYFVKQMKIGMTGMTIAAYLLHPKYKGFGLSADAKEQGLLWLERKFPFSVIMVSEIQKLKSQYFYSPFMNSEVYTKMDPRYWWKAAATPAVPQIVVEMLDSLYIMPASTSNLERCFSTLGNIMTKHNNRLSLEKASKLCMINNHFKSEKKAYDSQCNIVRKKKKRKLFDLNTDNN